MNPQDSSPGEGRIALIGAGIMGSAMAANLARAGLPLTVWDRSPKVLEPIAALGAEVASGPDDAVRQARVVITMLPTPDVVDAVMLDPGVVSAFQPESVWAQMGTIGVQATLDIRQRLAGLRPDVLFVDAPVSGSKGPAEAGELLILASGPPEAAEIVGPAFSAIGRRTAWVGEAGQGSRLKLVVNAYLSILVEGVAETLELAERMGVDPESLNQVIEGGPLDAPIAEAKLHKMESGDYAPEFPLEWALKDVNLVRGEAGDVHLPMLDALARQWEDAVKNGHGREDVSAARLQLVDGAR